MLAGLTRQRLRSIQLSDRLRLAWLRRQHPGLELDPAASSNLASARFRLAPGARLRIGPGVVTERIREGVHFVLEEDARVEIGAGTWLRAEVAPIHIAVFRGARLTIGPDSFLNGCHLSAKSEVTLGRRCWVGPGSRVFDSDQHDYDSARPEALAPVHLGSHVWIASDVTVLKGVSVGDHSIVGTRSLVTRDVPAHTLALGQPATPRGEVGDRSQAH